MEGETIERLSYDLPFSEQNTSKEGSLGLPKKSFNLSHSKHKSSIYRLKCQKSKLVFSEKDVAKFKLKRRFATRQSQA